VSCVLAAVATRDVADGWRFAVVTRLDFAAAPCEQLYLRRGVHRCYTLGTVDALPFVVGVVATDQADCATCVRLDLSRAAHTLNRLAALAARADLARLTHCRSPS